MPITVFFRGPMLFLCDRDMSELTRIIIPDTTEPGCHVDRTPRRPHHAGILTSEQGSNESHRLLSNARGVRIVADGETGAPKVDQSFKSLVCLNEMAETSEAYKLRRAQLPSGCIEVELFGGTMFSDPSIGETLEVPHHKGAPSPLRFIPSFALWRSDSAETGYIHIDGRPGQPLQKGVETYVYLWDDPSPSSAALKKPVVEKEFEDLDMKWTYSLFEPATQPTWAEWLGNDTLPVPRTKGFIPKKCRPDDPECCKPSRTSPTATCDGCIYCE